MSEPVHPTILLVEDEFASLEVLTLMLESEGYRVLAASDGKEALELLEAEPTVPDLVLTDFQMPRINGEMLAQKLLAAPLWSAIPVIMMSAAFPDELGRASNVVARFAKPLLFAKLLVAVRRIVTGAEKSAD